MPCASQPLGMSSSTDGGGRELRNELGDARMELWQAFRSRWHVSMDEDGRGVAARGYAVEQAAREAAAASHGTRESVAYAERKAAGTTRLRTIYVTCSRAQDWEELLRGMLARRTAHMAWHVRVLAERETWARARRFSRRGRRRWIRARAALVDLLGWRAWIRRFVAAVQRRTARERSAAMSFKLERTVLAVAFAWAANDEHREVAGTHAHRDIFRVAPLEWLVGVLYLVECALGRWMLDRVSSCIRRRIRQALDVPQGHWGTAMGRLMQGLGLHALREACRLLQRLTPEMLAAKRWHRLVDRLVLPRCVLGWPFHSGSCWCVYHAARCSLSGAAHMFRFLYAREARRAARRLLRAVYSTCGVPGVRARDLPWPPLFAMWPSHPYRPVT